MTPSDPECHPLARDDAKLTDVRLDHLAPKAHIQLYSSQFEAAIRRTRGFQWLDYPPGIGATYFLSSTVPKQTRPAGRG